MTSPVTAGGRSLVKLPCQGRDSYFLPAPEDGEFHLQPDFDTLEFENETCVGSGRIYQYFY